MKRTVVPRNRTVSVIDDLKSDVLSGHWKPGQRLVFAKLSERYGTSMGVLREALQRLVEQGLVVTQANLGFRVISISVSDLEDLTDARCELEGMALRRSVVNGDLTWESRVLAAHHVLAGIPYGDGDDPTRPSQAWLEAHAQFHDSLLDACPNRRIRSIATNLRDAAELYRTWSVAFSPRDILGEHKAILDAAVSRDVDLAESLLRHHISLTTENLIEALAKTTNDEDQEMNASEVSA